MTSRERTDPDGDDLLRRIDEALECVRGGEDVEPLLEQLEPALAREVRDFVSLYVDFRSEDHAGPGGRMAAWPASDLVGRSIDGHTVLRRIGRGGMGVVYEARQEHPSRIVALKVLRVDAGLAADDAKRRFLRETSLQSRLRHPNIAQVYGAGCVEVDGHEVWYFTMECVHQPRNIVHHAEGIGLAERLSLFIRVCEACHHGHRQGVLHRDLKPSNILVDADGIPKIIDFGVGRLLDVDDVSGAARTTTGLLVGTLPYMSPEQCGAHGGQLDARSDVYTLGVVLFQVLTGRLPYELPSSLMSALHTICETRPRRPSDVDPKLPGDVDVIVGKALAKDRDSRYGSAAEFAEDLRRFLEDRPLRARPPSLGYQLRLLLRRRRALSAAVLAALLVAVLGPATYFYREKEREARTRAHATRVQAAATAIERGDIPTARAMLGGLDSGWLVDHLRWRCEDSLGVVVQCDRGSVRSLAVDVTGRYVAVALGGANAGVVVRRLADGQRVLRRRGVEEAEAVAFSRPGTLLGVAGRDGLTVLAMEDDWRARLIATGQPAMSLAFHPRRDLVAIGLAAPEEEPAVADVEVWRLTDEPERVATLSGHGDKVCDVAFSPDGRLLASVAYEDRVVRIWDLAALQDGRLVSLRPSCELDGGEGLHAAGHSYHVTGVDFSPSGRRLATVGIDGRVCVWQRSPDDLAGRAWGLEDALGTSNALLDVAFVGEDRLAFGGVRPVVGVWELRRDGAPRTSELLGHAGQVVSIRAVPGAPARFASASDDGTVRLWSPETEPIGVLRGHTSSVHAVFLLDDGRAITGSGGDREANLALWRTRDGSRVADFGVEDLKLADVASRMAQQGTTLVVATKAGQVRRVSVVGDRFRLESSFSVGEPVLALALAPGSGDLAISTPETGLRIWRATPGEAEPWRERSEHRGRLPAARVLTWLDPHGRWLASGGGPRSGEALLADDPPLLCVLDLESSRVSRLSRSSGIWDVATHPSWSRTRLFATTEDAGVVALWRLRENGEVVSVGEPLRWSGSANAAAFHPTESLLFTGWSDGCLGVWDYDRRIFVALRQHDGPIFDIAVDRAGDVVVTASGGFHGSDNVAKVFKRHPR